MLKYLETKKFSYFFYKTILNVTKFFMDSYRLIEKMDDLKVKASMMDDMNGIPF